jgi:tetratricopeptide (TPR) repeat protein
MVIGDLINAEAHFKKAMSLDPFYPSTYPNYARFLNVTARYDECIELYERTRSVSGIKADMMVLEAAESLEALGRFDEAVEYYKKCILKSRETPTVVYAKDCLERCKIKLEVLDSE